MTNTQLAKYEFNALITNHNEPSDHELLLMLVEKVKKIETRLDNIVNKNHLIE